MGRKGLEGLVTGSIAVAKIRPQLYPKSGLLMDCLRILNKMHRRFVRKPGRWWPGTQVPGEADVIAGAEERM